MSIEQGSYQLLYLMTALQTDPSSRLSNRNLEPAERRAAHRKACNSTVQHIKHLTNIHAPTGLNHRTDPTGCLISQNLRPHLGSAYQLVKLSSLFVLKINLYFVSFLLVFLQNICPH
jgi:hypothetical protein